MKTMLVRSSVHSGLEPWLEQCHELFLEDGPIGKGTFGKVYRCSNVDRNAVTPLVVKIFRDAAAARHCMDTLRELQNALRREHQQRARSGSSLLKELPALVGVPLLSFEGELDGLAVSGTVAYDLTAMGMEELVDALDEERENAGCRSRFEATSIETRVEMATGLLAAMKFLQEKTSFLHCDLKAEAVFFKVSPPQCAFIDYDGGVVLRKPSDLPSTLGTLTGWIALEIKRQMDPRKQAGPVKVSLASEQWSAACLVHALICPYTQDPFFFLTAFSEEALQAYAAQYRWPDIDDTFPYFNPANEEGYALYRSWIDNEVPQPLRRLFAHIFTDGLFDPTQRASFAQWIMALQTAVIPAIHRFAANPAYLTQKRPVRLSWETSGASRLELRGFGDVTGKAFYDVWIRRATDFELILRPTIGSPLSKRLHVAVDERPPEINFFHAERQFLTDAKPTRLSWSINRAAHVELTPGVGDVTGLSSIDVAPRQDTTYTLRAVSHLDVEADSVLQITVSKRAPDILLFGISVAIVQEGEEAELLWATDGAETVQITPEVGTVVGYRGSSRVRPATTTKYTLRAESRFGAVSIKTVMLCVARRAVLNLNQTASGAQYAVLRPQTRLHAPSAKLLPPTSLRLATPLLPRSTKSPIAAWWSHVNTRRIQRQMEEDVRR